MSLPLQSQRKVFDLPELPAAPLKAKVVVQEPVRIRLEDLHRDVLRRLPGDLVRQALLAQVSGEWQAGVHLMFAHLADDLAGLCLAFCNHALVPTYDWERRTHSAQRKLAGSQKLRQERGEILGYCGCAGALTGER